MTAPLAREAGGRTHAERLADLERSIAAYPDVRPSQGGHAAAAAIRRAQSLACLVRDEDAASIGAYLDRLDGDQLYALVVTLAAMVPVDQPATDLLGWLEPLGRELERDAQRRTAAA